MIWHGILFGLFLGWGAAIPIGPMNVEIIRRNLRLGVRYGLAFAAGACVADLVYLVLLSLGLLVFLKERLVMHVITVIGSCVLLYFAYGALLMKPDATLKDVAKKASQHLARHGASGCLLTLLNPYTVIFWLSVSAQIAALESDHKGVLLWAGLGVLLGTFSWAFGLNAVLALTRHKISGRSMRALNIAGGVVLFVFAGVGFYRVLV